MSCFVRIFTGRSGRPGNSDMSDSPANVRTLPHPGIFGQVRYRRLRPDIPVISDSSLLPEIPDIPGMPLPPYSGGFCPGCPSCPNYTTSRLSYFSTLCPDMSGHSGCYLCPTKSPYSRAIRTCQHIPGDIWGLSGKSRHVGHVLFCKL